MLKITQPAKVEAHIVFFLLTKPHDENVAVSLYPRRACDVSVCLLERQRLVVALGC